MQFSWRGRESNLNCSLRIEKRPFSFQKAPWRAMRVGWTQSNMSMPRSMASNKSSGVPTPMR